ncbi:MAG: hypothetical protein ACI8YI_001593, partial [Paracoccaceae bacterium]
VSTYSIEPVVSDLVCLSAFQVAVSTWCLYSWVNGARVWPQIRNEKKPN